MAVASAESVKPVRQKGGFYLPSHILKVMNKDPRSGKKGAPKKIINNTPRDYLKNTSWAYNAPINGPIYDWNTKNRSFIDVHKQLKMLGVKNNAFHLILYNPALVGVDPYSTNLTRTQVCMIIQECSINMFYYLREVIRIPEQGATNTMFKMDRGTLAACYCFINDINFYLMKPRQTGKSVGICAMLSWAFKFGVTNGHFMFAGNVEKTPKDNLKKMKTYLASLPPYLARMGTSAIDSYGKIVRRTNNIKSYIEPATGNSATVAGIAVSEAAAREIGRGESHVQEFYDEAEFTSFIDEIVDTCGPAFNTASQNALGNGGHACRIFASTPGDLGDEKKCKRALILINDAVKFEEKKFYDDFGNDVLGLKEMVNKKSKYRLVYIEYSYKQLGYGEDWFRWICGEVGHKPAKIRREVLLQRFAGNSLSPFNENDIIEINENKKKPVFTQTVNKLYDLRFYVKPEDIPKKRVHFISIDPSDGTGGDYYGMVIVDPYTLQTVMEFKSNFMSPSDCLKLVSFIVKTYFPKVMIIIEKNRNGTAVSDVFSESWLKPFLYASPKADMSTYLGMEEYDEKGFLKFERERRKYFGIHTMPTSRDIMMGLLTDSVRFKKDIVTAEYLVEEVNDLVIKNDKIQAASGKHDDIVMAWVICLYTIYYGEKLERWGFRKGQLPNDIEEDDEFTQLKKIYDSPVIRQHFPTMYSFWKSVTSKEMEKEHRNRIEEQVRQQSPTTRGIGVISEDDIMLDGISPTQENEPWKRNLLDKWNSMNN